jgi:hypothetical protein
MSLLVDITDLSRSAVVERIFTWTARAVCQDIR